MPDPSVLRESMTSLALETTCGELAARVAQLEAELAAANERALGWQRWCERINHQHGLETRKYREIYEAYDELFPSKDTTCTTCHGDGKDPDDDEPDEGEVRRDCDACFGHGHVSWAWSPDCDGECTDCKAEDVPVASWSVDRDEYLCLRCAIVRRAECVFDGTWPLAPAAWFERAHQGSVTVARRWSDMVALQSPNTPKNSLLGRIEANMERAQVAAAEAHDIGYQKGYAKGCQDTAAELEAQIPDISRVLEVGTPGIGHVKVPGRWAAMLFATAFGMFCQSSHATNYVEFGTSEPIPFTVIVQKTDGKTPNQLRLDAIAAQREAEARAEACEAMVALLLERGKLADEAWGDRLVTSDDLTDDGGAFEALREAMTRGRDLLATLCEGRPTPPALWLGTGDHGIQHLAHQLLASDQCVIATRRERDKAERERDDSLAERGTLIALHTARQAGYEAGREGGSQDDNPYKDASERNSFHAHWEGGFLHGRRVTDEGRTALEALQSVTKPTT